MAEVKPATLRNSPSVAASSRVTAQVRAEPRPPVQPRPAVQDRFARDAALPRADAATDIVGDFVAPTARTSSWLGDPRLVATLEAASAALAPEGVTKDATDRYAASVIETHLVARRRLSKLTNALLKT